MATIIPTFVGGIYLVSGDAISLIISPGTDMGLSFDDWLTTILTVCGRPR